MIYHEASCFSPHLESGFKLHKGAGTWLGPSRTRVEVPAEIPGDSDSCDQVRFALRQLPQGFNDYHPAAETEPPSAVAAASLTLVLIVNQKPAEFLLFGRPSCSSHAGSAETGKTTRAQMQPRKEEAGSTLGNTRSWDHINVYLLASILLMFSINLPSHFSHSKWQGHQIEPIQIWVVPSTASVGSKISLAVMF